MKQVQPGGICWGSHDPIRLWKAFRLYMPDNADWVLEGDRLLSILEQQGPNYSVKTKLSSLVNNEAMNYMESLAPDGYYFGYWGTGAYYGYWKIEKTV